MGGLLAGSYLAIFGLAVMVAALACLRLWNRAHAWTAGHGWTRPPRRYLPPIRYGNDLILCALALSFGVAAAAAFIAPVLDLVPLFVLPAGADPILQLVRVVWGLVGFLILLVLMAIHPWWKLAWGLAWCTFSVCVGLLS